MERRSTVRRRVDLSAEANGEPVRLVDFSLDGARFELGRGDSYALGDRVTLTVTLQHAPGTATLHCMGRVLRCQPATDVHAIAIELGSIHLEDPRVAIAVLGRH